MKTSVTMPSPNGLEFDSKTVGMVSGLNGVRDAVERRVEPGSVWERREHVVDRQLVEVGGRVRHPQGDAAPIVAEIPIRWRVRAVAGRDDRRDGPARVLPKADCNSNSVGGCGEKGSPTAIAMIVSKWVSLQAAARPEQLVFS